MDDELEYTFCMCNPPFFDESGEDVVEKLKEPRNAFTGTPNELACPGGEVAFVQRIVTESLELQQKIKYELD